MVMDPNGQLSVAYLDQEGRTIATALAGEGTDNLVDLESNASTEIVVNLAGRNAADLANGVIVTTHLWRDI